MTAVTNLLIVGVGGQGTILSSRILSHLLSNQGYQVKVSEIHGMSQRGGSVVTQVRFGDEVHSPIIRPGTVDTILSFEQLEALRWLPWLKPVGKMIVNMQKLMPMPVITGQAAYPDGIDAQIKKTVPAAILIDGLSLAKEAGNDKSVNLVLLGKLSKSMNLPEEAWIAAIRQTVNPKILDVNLTAFALGRNA